MKIFSIYIYTCPVKCIVISTAQTDLGLISITVSLKRPTFYEITQAWQCLKIVFIPSDEFKY